MAGYNPYAPPTQDSPPLAPNLAGGGTGAPVPWTVSEVLSVGFNAVKRNPVELIGGFFLTTLLTQLPSLLPMVLEIAGIVREGTTIYLVLSAVSMVVGVLAGTFFWVGQIRVALAAARQQPFELGLFFSGGDRLLPMLLTTVLWYLGVTLGMILLIVPGVILLLGWSLAGPLVVEAEESPVEALKESWEFMRGHKGQMLLLGLVSVLIMVAGLCACYVGVLIVWPAVMVAYMEAFRRITGRMEGTTAGVRFEPAVAAPGTGGWMNPPPAS